MKSILIFLKTIIILYLSFNISSLFFSYTDFTFLFGFTIVLFIVLNVIVDKVFAIILKKNGIDFLYPKYQIKIKIDEINKYQLEFSEANITPEQRYNISNSINQDSNISTIKYTEVMSSLKDKIEFKVIDIKNYDTGYIELTTVVTPKEKFTFPNTVSEAYIDGSFVVKLYDKDKSILFAEGIYSISPKINGNSFVYGLNSNHFSKTIILKKVKKNYININKGYLIEIDNPNLWLVKSK